MDCREDLESAPTEARNLERRGGHLRFMSGLIVGDEH